MHARRRQPAAGADRRRQGQHAGAQARHQDPQAVQPGQGGRRAEVSFPHCSGAEDRAVRHEARPEASQSQHRTEHSLLSNACSGLGLTDRAANTTLSTACSVQLAQAWNLTDRAGLTTCCGLQVRDGVRQDGDVCQRQDAQEKREDPAAGHPRAHSEEAPTRCRQEGPHHQGASCTRALLTYASCAWPCDLPRSAPAQQGLFRQSKQQQQQQQQQQHMARLEHGCRQPNNPWGCEAVASKTLTTPGSTSLRAQCERIQPEEQREHKAARV